MTRHLIAAIAFLAAACCLPGAAQAQQTVMDAFGRTVSNEEARRLTSRIAQLERTSGLQASTIAGIAQRLGLRYSDLSEERLFRQLENLVREAATLQREIGVLRATVAELSDLAARDPATGILTRVDKAFADGDLATAEQALSELSFLRQTEGATVQRAWIEAVRAQASAAELQGVPEDFDRAEALRKSAEELLETQARQNLIDRWTLAMDRAAGRALQGELLGDIASLERAKRILESEVLPMVTKEALPFQFGATHAEIGRLETMLAGKVSVPDSSPYYSRAFDAFAAAADSIDPEQHPLPYAAMELSAGAMLIQLADRNSPESARELLPVAIGYFLHAMQLVPEDSPLVGDFALNTAEAMRNLASLNESDRTLSDNQFASSLRTSEFAIGRHNPEAEPRKWARAQSNKCNTLVEWAFVLGLDGGSEKAEEAMQTCNLGLTPLDRDGDPVIWASLQYNLGRAEMFFAIVSKDSAARERARTHLLAALSVWNELDFPRQNLEAATAIQLLDQHS